MMTDYEELARLERMYDGPIPKGLLNSALGRVIPPANVQAIRWHRNMANSAFRALKIWHESRARLEARADSMTEEAWEYEDTRVTAGMTNARNDLDQALATLAKLKVEE